MLATYLTACEAAPKAEGFLQTPEVSLQVAVQALMIISHRNEETVACIFLAILARPPSKLPGWSEAGLISCALYTL